MFKCAHLGIIKFLHGSGHRLSLTVSLLLSLSFTQLHSVINNNTIVYLQMVLKIFCQVCLCHFRLNFAFSFNGSLCFFYLSLLPTLSLSLFLSLFLILALPLSFSSTQLHSVIKCNCLSSY